MTNREELWRIAPGVGTTLLIALVLWWLLARAASRARRHFQELLDAEADLDHAMDGRIFATTQRRLTALKLVANTARYALFIGTGLMLLSQFGVKLDTLVLPAGFLGAALGLGAQSLIKDVVAGVFIIFEGQFGVGDVVSINGTLGIVEEVGLRVTRLRADNGQLFFFPNGSITAVAKYPARHVVMDVWLTLEDDTQYKRAESIVADALKTFETRYRVLETSTSLRSETSGETLHYQLLVRPARVALTGEKLPLHLMKSLDAAGIILKADAPLEVTSAAA